MLKAAVKAVWNSATLPAPPISNTRVPEGERREWSWLKRGLRVEGERRIQWRAALLKILSKDSFFSFKDGALDKSVQSWSS